MLTSERKRLILDTLRRDGRVVAKTLATELGLSEDTIRKDLRDLAAEGLLARVHGGALPLSVTLPDLSARTRIATDEKRRLGRAAAALIEPEAMVFFDGGTTNAEIIRALPETATFSAVTHSPTIASELQRLPSVEVVLIGGRLYRHSMVAVGVEAAEAIGRLRPDLFFMGATAVDGLAGFSTGDVEEAAIKRLIHRQAHATWLLMTQEKIGMRSPVTVMPVREAAGVVIDRAVTDDETAVFGEAGVRLVRA